MAKRIRKKKWKNTKPITNIDELNDYLKNATSLGMKKSKEAGVKMGRPKKEKNILGDINDVLDQISFSGETKQEN